MGKFENKTTRFKMEHFVLTDISNLKKYIYTPQDLARNHQDTILYIYIGKLISNVFSKCAGKVGSC